jgi:VIT1/CCC1 family predicted Fe2+/Mn2+ transporter
MRNLHRPKPPLGADNFLSVLEGVEGGFAIFTGIVVGLSFEVISRDLLLLTAGIGIIVNAFNSSAVRYASEHYLDELDGRETKHPWSHYFMPALIEFLVYAVVSVIAILPLLFVHPIDLAIICTIALTLVILFCAGFYRGTLLRTHRVRDGLEVALLGGLIILVGGAAGLTLSFLVA